jgi:hypothetical protein
MASTLSIPRHVAQALGTSMQLRSGCSTSSASTMTTTSAIRGTTELRIPLSLPMVLAPPQFLQSFLQQDANLVVYTDWLFSMMQGRTIGTRTIPPTESSSSSSSRPLSMLQRQSCIGIGLRKTIQGIPLQYDITYSNEGQTKAMFGLGRDFVF